MDSAVDVLDLNNASLYRMGIEPALGNNIEVEEDDLGCIPAGRFPLRAWRAHAARQSWRTLRADGPDFDGILVHHRQRQLDSADYGGARVLGHVCRRSTWSMTSATIPGAFRRRQGDDASEPWQLNPGAAVSVSGNNRTVTAGNPDLEPFRADCLRPVVRVVFRAGIAAVGRAVLQGHQDRSCRRSARCARSPTIRWDCPIAWRSPPAAARTDVRRTPTGSSTCRRTRRVAT